MNSNVNPAKQFYNMVMEDPSLQNQFIGVDNEDALFDKAVQLGKQNGFVFTKSELMSSISEQESLEESELSDSLLEAVAGGKEVSGASSSQPIG